MPVASVAEVSIRFVPAHNMENPAANQLPEVDALPDGFVDGTAEPLCPPTPNNEEQKPPSDFRIDSGSRLDGLEHELVDLDDKGHIGQDFGSPLTPGLAHSPPEDSSEVPGSCEVKEQAQEKFQSSDKCKYLYLKSRLLSFAFFSLLLSTCCLGPLLFIDFDA